MCKNANTDGEGAQYVMPILGVWFSKPDALPGLVMAYADGGSLSDYIKDVSFTLRDRITRVSRSCFSGYCYNSQLA